MHPPKPHGSFTWHDGHESIIWVRKKSAPAMIVVLIHSIPQSELKKQTKGHFETFVDSEKSNVKLIP